MAGRKKAEEAAPEKTLNKKLSKYIAELNSDIYKEDLSETGGIYRHKFEAPKSWSGQRVKIYFDGVMTDTEVFINGKLDAELLERVGVKPHLREVGHS